MRRILKGIVLYTSSLCAYETISMNMDCYRNIVRKAVEDEAVFSVFRSIDDYRCIVELGHTPGVVRYVQKVDPRIKAKLKKCEALDRIGSPICYAYPRIGTFSPTVLRYICVADQILKFFSLPQHVKIAEIGVGFGGQAFILSQLLSIDSYYLFDLPEVEKLVEKMMGRLGVDNCVYMPLGSELPEPVDLVISNYAFSECDPEIQMEYFRNVLMKANAGFMIYNSRATHATKNLGTLTIEEFAQLLEQAGFKTRILKELIPTAAGNQTIVWTR